LKTLEGNWQTSTGQKGNHTPWLSISGFSGSTSTGRAWDIHTDERIGGYCDGYWANLGIASNHLGQIWRYWEFPHGILSLHLRAGPVVNFEARALKVYGLRNPRRFSCPNNGYFGKKYKVC